ncbi:Rossmann-fold NAD(P)-binding domain-containing protein [Sandarakinorhabdus oryzae]|uniref:NAD-dependent dehydratase n=1 Tax=Sandarakinorhabdus oryzae TaxID=2675220 RepID=UPI0018CC5A93|nr:NAD-dependent dehydratase [Sandarakinorhabdus oryzae]
MRVLLAGATGLVGGLVLKATEAMEIIPVSRRPIPGHLGVVADFDDLPPLPEAQVAVCALGTTRAKAGSDAAFRAVDHDAVLAFARAAKAAGVTHFILVSSVGANPRSSLLYPRTKGEVEVALTAMGFSSLDILQPGLLIGPRAERRPVERFLQWAAPVMDPFLPRDVGSLPAEAVAGAIVTLTMRSEPGVFRHTNRVIASLTLT